MMRRIEAEERLAAITDRALAAGNMERFEGRRHREQLQRTARGGARTKPARANPAALAGMGIAVVGAPSAAAQEGLSDA